MKPQNSALSNVALLYSLTLYNFIEHVMLNNIGCVLQMDQKTVLHLGIFLNTSMEGYLTEHHTNLSLWPLALFNLNAHYRKLFSARQKWCTLNGKMSFSSIKSHNIGL
jgi:hypothetical protein